MIAKPDIPGEIARRQTRQNTPEILPCDTPHYAAAAGSGNANIDRKPHTPRFEIVENKREIVGPAARGQSQDIAIDLATVHDSQTSQRSVSGCDECRIELVVGNLMPDEVR